MRPGSIPGVLTVVEPRDGGVPVVLDSPHSGRRIPADFAATAPLASLRTGEDSFVDRLFPAADHGATLLAAEFPRTYIDPNRPLDDIDPLLGDLDGTTCGRVLTDTVRGALEDLGYTVAVNDRFKGVDIVRACGRPGENRHSLQIEVVRDRYMDESRFVPGERFEAVRADLGRVLDAVRDLATG